MAGQSWECKVLRTALELTSDSCSQFPTHTQNQTTSPPIEHVKLLVQQTSRCLGSQSHLAESRTCVDYSRSDLSVRTLELLSGIGSGSGEG